MELTPRVQSRLLGSNLNTTAMSVSSIFIHVVLACALVLTLFAGVLWWHFRSLARLVSNSICYFHLWTNIVVAVMLSFNSLGAFAKCPDFTNGPTIRIEVDGILVTFQFCAKCADSRGVSRVFSRGISGAINAWFNTTSGHLEVCYAFITYSNCPRLCFEFVWFLTTLQYFLL